MIFTFFSTHVPSSSFMDSASAVSLSMFTGDYVNYIALFNLFLLICPSSSSHDHITVPIPFGIRYFPPIVYITL